MTPGLTPALTVEILASLRSDHAAEVDGLRRRCRDAEDQLDAARRRCVRLEADLAELCAMVSERSANVAAAAEEWMRDEDGAALAAENVRLRAEVARLKSMLADLGGPLAATAADCGSPGRSAEVASSDVTEAA
jgi:multidrug resistance efflux pump